MRLRLSAAVLAGAAALAGCGETDRTKIPESRAQAIIEEINQAERAVERGSCDTAQQQAANGAKLVAELPQRTNPQIRENLVVGFQRLSETIQAECEEPEEEPTPTETPEQTVTAEPTPTATATATATQTATPSATPTATATEQPGQEGGVLPPEEEEE